MKKLISSLVGYLLIPALLLGYHFTHHTGFLFIYGLLSVIVFLMFVILFLALNVIKNTLTFERMVKEFPSKNRRWFGILWSLCIFVFLVYENCYFLATLTFINAVLSHAWVSVMHKVKAKL